MNSNIFIEEKTFQKAWLKAITEILTRNTDIHNIMVTIQKPAKFDDSFHQRIRTFMETNGLIRPKHVVYTIFPYNLYKRCGTSDKLFEAYNRHCGLYARLRKKPHSSWGTYFRRMTHYEINGKVVNQLENIIKAIRQRSKVHKAAYTIVIQKPGGETVRPRGGPCLNYIAVQLCKKTNKLGLLCVYRNHDFIERAYGNYWGLCMLACFLARETRKTVGTIAVISSHAFIRQKKRAIKAFVQGMNEMA